MWSTYILFINKPIFILYTHNGILFSHKKENNLAICNNMNRPEGIILSEISQTDKDEYGMVWSHLCVDSKKAKFTETQSRWVVSRGWELVETGRCSKVQSSVRWINFGDVTYSMVTIGNNTVLLLEGKLWQI